MGCCCGSSPKHGTVLCPDRSENASVGQLGSRGVSAGRPEVYQFRKDREAQTAVGRINKERADRSDTEEQSGLHQSLISSSARAAGSRV